MSSIVLVWFYCLLQQTYCNSCIKNLYTSFRNPSTNVKSNWFSTCPPCFPNKHLNKKSLIPLFFRGLWTNVLYCSSLLRHGRLFFHRWRRNRSRVSCGPCHPFQDSLKGLAFYCHVSSEDQQVPITLVLPNVLPGCKIIQNHYGMDTSYSTLLSTSSPIQLGNAMRW